MTHSKSFRQLMLSSLPEDIKEVALDDVRDQETDSDYNKLTGFDFNKGLTTAFIWNKSRLGAGFWVNLFQKLN